MVRELVHPDDWCDMLGWYRAHGVDVPAPDWFGRGWIVPGVAAAFLYLTDGGRAYLEDVISNPEASAAERHAALVELAATCERVARIAGARYLVGWSREGDIAKRAAAEGYTDLGAFRGFAKRL